jgi:hypothetical protein
MMVESDALDKIRRQPVAPQAPNALLNNDVQRKQIGLPSIQLMQARQQSQPILEICNELGLTFFRKVNKELGMRHSALLQALRDLQRIINSLGHVAGYLESLLVSVYARQQYAHNVKFQLSHTESATSDMEAQKPMNRHHTPRTRKNIPVSPLRLAPRVSSAARTKHFVNFVDLEKQEQCDAPIEATGAMQFQIEIGIFSGRAP